ncbi:MAG: UvrD-helicase domain-containing protein [Muribaculaceae bacterium]
MLSIYKASAGSGKTFRLTIEYIKLALQSESESEKAGKPVLSTSGSNHSHILAITFTNKATEEMKTRIVKELSILAFNTSDSKLLDELKNYFQTDEASLQKAAEKALYDILFQFTFFNISTIDSFFQQVLRTFAADIERQDDFETSVDDKVIVQSAVHNVLDKISDNKDIYSWLRKYIQAEINKKSDFNFFNKNTGGAAVDIVDTVSKLMDDTFKAYSKLIVAYLSDPNRIKGFEEVMANEQKRFEKKNLQLLRNVEDLLEKEELAVFYKETKLHNIIKSKDFSDIDSGKLEKMANDPSSEFQKSKTIGSGKLTRKSEPSGDLCNAIKELANCCLSGLTLYNTCEAIRKSIYMLGILGVVNREMTEFCRDNEMILVSDTNDLLRKIISVGNVPFIYDRMGVFLHHYLIDEFQDTSNMQWKNIFPLLLESLANGKSNLIIGDDKQSIYRFRDAAPELLAGEVKDTVLKIFQGEGVITKGEKLSDNTNYRSAENVIKFNNTLFNALSLTDNFIRSAYSRSVQQIPKKKEDATKGYVKLRLLPKDIEPQEDGLGLSAEDSCLISDLKVLLQKNISPSEIAILIRNKADAVKAANAIQTAKIKGLEEFKDLQIKINGAVKISSCPSVKIIISTLYLLVDPEMREEFPDEESQEKIDKKKRYHSYSCLFEKLVSESVDYSEALVQALDGDKIALGSEKSLGNIVEDIRKMKTYASDDICGAIDLIVSGLNKPLRKRDTLYITSLQDLAYDYSQLGNTSIRSFLEWWESCGNDKTIEFPDDFEAVNIVTIHKSKGLQYKCVLIPYATWKFDDIASGTKNNFRWVDIPKEICELFDQNGEPGGLDMVPPKFPIKISSRLEKTYFSSDLNFFLKQDYQDTMNLLYVALTRAEDVLIVTAQQKQKTVGSYVYDVLNKVKYCFTEDGVKSALESSNANKDYGDISHLLTTAKYSEDDNIIEVGSLDDCHGKEKDNKCKKMPVYESFENELVLKKKNVFYSRETFNPNEARQKGTFFHSVLSEVETPDDLEYAFHKWAVIVGLDENNYKDKWLPLLKKALEQPEVQKWYDGTGKVINEYAVKDESGKVSRADRVVIKGDNVDIIDYKSGGESDSHIEQVEKYMNIYSAKGYKNVRGYIWYFLSGEIVEVKQKT